MSTNRYRGRLAPSPTGYLHLGHARTFLIAAQRSQGGTLILRNDDLDAQRAQPHFAAAMLQDLAWLGITWHEGPQWPSMEDAGSFGPYRQSARGHLYRDAFERLRACGAVYPCRCSRRDLQTAARAPHAEDDDEPIYPGACRSGNSQHPGEAVAWRFRVPPGEVVRFHDGNMGAQSFTAGVDFGDFVVQRRDGVASYHLACVVDDAAMRVTEVVRGRDLLRSTARQILLQRALGLPQPAYFHCPLAVNSKGHRLAKRSDALSLRAMRDGGLQPEQARALALTSMHV